MISDGWEKIVEQVVEISKKTAKNLGRASPGLNWGSQALSPQSRVAPHSLVDRQFHAQTFLVFDISEIRRLGLISRAHSISRSTYENADDA